MNGQVHEIQGSYKYFCPQKNLLYSITTDSHLTYACMHLSLATPQCVGGRAFDLKF